MDDPFGDGSGIFSVTATATDAVEYGFKVGNTGSETINSTGQFSYTVTDLGMNQFPFMYMLTLKIMIEYQGLRI